MTHQVFVLMNWRKNGKAQVKWSRSLKEVPNPVLEKEKVLCSFRAMQSKPW
jgi:hypothetical protein